MEGSFTLFLTLCLITLIVLIAGVIIMARGGKINKLSSTKLMTARIILQLLAILTLAAIYFTGK
jgi:hypothetical protein